MTSKYYYRHLNNESLMNHLHKESKTFIHPQTHLCCEIHCSLNFWVCLFVCYFRTAKRIPVCKTFEIPCSKVQR